VPTFEVTYKIIETNINESHAWQTSGPSHYTTVVTALHQGAAEQMVKSMNGGPNHCHIVRAMYLGD
jgi:hypothetical protein